MDTLLRILSEALFTIYKIPTHGEYLIEHDSIRPPTIQKIWLIGIIKASFDS